MWPDNEGAVRLFLVGATQWRTTLEARGTGLATVWIGLDYAGLAAVVAGAGLAASADDWAGMMVIEIAARDALNGG